MSDYETPSVIPFDKNNWTFWQYYETPSSVKTKCAKIDKFIKLTSQMMKRDEQLKTLVTAQNLKYMTTVIFDGDKNKKVFGMKDVFIITNGIRTSIHNYAEIGYARINRLQSEKFLPYIMLSADWSPETDEFTLSVEVRRFFVEDNPKNDQILEVIYNIIESTAKTAGVRLKKVRVTPNAHEIGKGGKIEWCKGLWKSKL